MIKNSIILTLAILMVIATIGCKKSTATSAPMALNASLMVNGTDMTGGTLSNPNQGDHMNIGAQFTDPQGNHTIRNAVAIGSHSMGMMSHLGDITLWDDGTHGDDIAGDGWFHMENEMADMMASMGHGWNDIMGDYEFEVYCIDEDGNESNHISVHMNIQN
jgi:hypothetical protein